MDELITQAGVGGVLSILILREVLPFMSKAKAKANGEVVKELADRAARADHQLTSIHKTLDAKDQDGVRLIYSRRSLDDVINRLATCIEKQTEMMRDMHGEVKDTRRDVEVIRDAVRSCGGGGRA